MLLSVGPLALFAHKLRRRTRLLLQGETAHSYFDIHDRQLVDRLLAEHSLQPLPLPPLEFAMQEGHPTRGEAVYELRDDVRQAIPLALTPAQRGEYLRWFLRFGRHEIHVEFADVLRELFKHDAARDRGLAATFRVQPAWQRHMPNALTPEAWPAFKRWLAANYRIKGRWLRRASLSQIACCEVPSRTRRGINVLGLFRYTSGLQQAAESMVDGLRAAGIATELRDVPMPFQRDERSRVGFDGLERFPITLLNTGLDMPVVEAYRLAALQRQPEIYRIAMWWWELEQVPVDWMDRGRDVQEIWAPTTFIANALQSLGKPVFPMLPSVRLPAFTFKSKVFVGLDPRRFTFLFVFDMNSRLPRKNPLGLIEAFRLAFRRDEPAELAIKVNPQEDVYREWWAQLRVAARNANVTLIEKNFDRGQLLSLMNAADAYVSLHRSEGFGLTMAEAMLLGKPTIATGYSGNLDFMTDENSYLVNYSPTTIQSAIDPYPKGATWAEPDVRHAAAQMRKVFENQAAARAVGERARTHLQALLAPEAAGKRMAERIDAILSRRPT